MASTSFADSACVDADCRIRNISGFYANGDYNSITAELAMVQGELRPEEKFYLGMAYFGLFGQTRSKALQCEYRENTQDLLRLFLLDQRSKYKTIGTYGSDQEIRQVYAATRSMQELEKIDGCLESGLTIPALRLETQKFVSETLDRILMQSPPQDNLLSPEERQVYRKGQDVWDTVQRLTQLFVGKASNIESEIAKKFVEYDAAHYNIEQIKSDLSAFGQVKVINGNLSLEALANDGINKAESNVAAWRQQVDSSNATTPGHKQKFQKALQGMTPETYDSKRFQIIEEAKAMKTKLSWAESQVSTLMLDEQSPIHQVTNEASGNASAALNAMKAKWLEYGKVDIKCKTESIWYCPKSVRAPQ
jgi:hypothetical protein